MHYTCTETLTGKADFLSLVCGSCCLVPCCECQWIASDFRNQTDELKETLNVISCMSLLINEVDLTSLCSDLFLLSDL